MDNLRTPWSVTTSYIQRIVVAIAAPAVVTLLAIPEQHPSPPVIAVLFVLAVVVAARVGGAVPGIVASLLSFLSLNFFFTPPFTRSRWQSPKIS